MPPKCKTCLKYVKDNCRSFKCEICHHWFHLRCTTLSIRDHNYYSTSNNQWSCLHCQQNIFPFFALDVFELAQLSFNSNLTCLCSKKISNLKLETLPCFDLMSSISKHSNLSKIDVDSHLPVASHFDYYA